ncbi:MAG: hypothetical protein WCP01_15235 [Methylococcaceae bacterium]
MLKTKTDLSKIKANLSTIARIQVNATYEDIASISDIESELTSTQMTN